jgi:alpha-glucosidase
LPQATLRYEDLQDPEAIANWPLTLGRDGARTPMPWHRQAPHAGFSHHRPWLPVDPEHARRAVDVQADDPQSTLSVARRLLRARRTSAALRQGSMTFRNVAPPLLHFERKAQGERLLCAFNFDAKSTMPTAFPPGSWRIVESVGGAGGEHLPPLSGCIARALE